MNPPSRGHTDYPILNLLAEAASQKIDNGKINPLIKAIEDCKEHISLSFPKATKILPCSTGDFSDKLSLVVEAKPVYFQNSHPNQQYFYVKIEKLTQNFKFLFC